MDRRPLIEIPGLLARPGNVGAGESPPRLLLGVDGGATKTVAAAVDLVAGRAGIGRSGPSNPDNVGTEAARSALFEAAEDALAAAGVGGERPDGAIIAAAATELGPLSRAIRAESSAENWIVIGDVLAAWAAATGAQPGVGAIAGTGSNVLGIGPDGRAWRAGGWGHMLGDEASGYWLAIQALRAALADRDGSGPETSLSEAARDFFGVAGVQEIPVLIFARSLKTHELASFALDVSRVAAAGDPVARSLYEQGAILLGAQITSVIERTGLEGEFPVGLIGSAFKAGECFLDPLEREVRRVAPEARFQVAEMSPVEGALLLAARAAGAGAEVSADGAIHGRLAEIIATALRDADDSLSISG